MHNQTAMVQRYVWIPKDRAETEYLHALDKRVTEAANLEHGRIQIRTGEQRLARYCTATRKMLIVCKHGPSCVRDRHLAASFSIA
jgi:hypothetical protein